MLNLSANVSRARLVHLRERMTMYFQPSSLFR